MALDLKGKCTECRASYIVCDVCRRGVLVGSSQGVHFLQCSVEKTLGDITGYEAPAGLCPCCYHGHSTTVWIQKVLHEVLVRRNRSLIHGV